MVFVLKRPSNFMDLKEKLVKLVVLGGRDLLVSLSTLCIILCMLMLYVPNVMSDQPS